MACRISYLQLHAASKFIFTSKFCVSRALGSIAYLLNQILCHSHFSILSQFWFFTIPVGKWCLNDIDFYEATKINVAPSRRKTIHDNIVMGVARLTFLSTTIKNYISPSLKKWIFAHEIVGCHINRYNTLTFINEFEVPNNPYNNSKKRVF